MSTRDLRARRAATKAKLKADNASKVAKQSTAPYNYNGAVVTFVDDDGSTGFWNNAKPVYDAKGVKITLGIIPSFVGTSGYMGNDKLVILQNNGYEIAGHSMTHSAAIFRDNLASVPDSAFETEFNDCQQWLYNNGFTGYDVLVYPYGNFGTEAARIKRVARKYFRYALNAVGSYNTSPVDNVYLQRVFLDKTQDFTTVLKPIIDNCIYNKAWLIIGTHSHFSAQFDATYLATVIDYLQANSIPILPFGEAVKYKGNALSVGEYTDTTNGRFFLGNDGAIIANGVSSGTNIIQGIYTDTSGNSMNDAITKYPVYKVTYAQIRAGSYDPLTGEGGVLETFRGGQYFSYQKYYPVTTLTMYYRKWVGTDTGGSWSAWKQVTMA